MPRRSGGMRTPRASTPRSSTPRSSTPRAQRQPAVTQVPRTTKAQALVAAQSERATAPPSMQVFRHPTISPGTRLGYVSAHPFGLSDWMRQQWSNSSGARQCRTMTSTELKAHNARGASLTDLNITAQATSARFEPKHITGMTLRDAKRRRWHAQKAIDHMTSDMQLTGSETTQARTILQQYADSHSVRADGGTHFLQVTMPMTGEAAKWREPLESDGVAQSIPKQSVPPSTRGNGNILESGAVATVNHPDGAFHMIRHFPENTLERARFMRGIPPGYGGFIPHHIRQLSAPPRAPRYVPPEREVMVKPARQLSPDRGIPPSCPPPKPREGWSAHCAATRTTAVRV